MSLSWWWTLLLKEHLTESQSDSCMESLNLQSTCIDHADNIYCYPYTYDIIAMTSPLAVIVAGGSTSMAGPAALEQVWQACQRPRASSAVRLWTLCHEVEHSATNEHASLCRHSF